MAAAGGANLVEVFSSFQGEGPHVGAATLFVRFGRCDLRCRWCDSPHTWRAAERCRIETRRGAGVWRSVANPVATSEVLAAAEALELAEHAFVSLTGGEPLLQPEAVASLAGALRGRGPRIHLETHGLAVAALERVVGAVDVVAMDWKLASDVRREGVSFREPEEAFHDVHERFLAVARRAPEVFAKVVVTEATRRDELEAVAERLARSGPEVALVLQPVTPRGGAARPPAWRLLAWQAELSRRLADVRIIPQAHPVLGAP